MNGRPRNEEVEMANAEYEVEKAEAIKRGHCLRITIPMIEKRRGLKPGQIFNYRTNHGLSIRK